MSAGASEFDQKLQAIGAKYAHLYVARKPDNTPLKEFKLPPEDWAVDFGEPNPVIVPRTYTEAEMREAQAVALEEAADEMPNPSDGWGMNQRSYLRARAVTVRGGE